LVERPQGEGAERGKIRTEKKKGNHKGKNIAWKSKKEGLLSGAEISSMKIEPFRGPDGGRTVWEEKKVEAGTLHRVEPAPEDKNQPALKNGEKDIPRSVGGGKELLREKKNVHF